MNNLFPCTKFAEKFKVKDNVLLYHWKPEGLIQTAKIVGKRKEIVDRDSQITIFLKFFFNFWFCYDFLQNLPANKEPCLT